MTVLSISSVGPHDFELCLRNASRFRPDLFPDLTVFRTAVRVQDNPTVLEMRQVRPKPPALEIRTTLPNSAPEVKRIARWIIFADLDLRPFYRIAASHPILEAITKKLHGLKPMRPASLFEMLVEEMSDEDVRFRLLQIRGLGPWSAEYFLVRGLSRPDRVPAEDLGI